MISWRDEQLNISINKEFKNVKLLIVEKKGVRIKKNEGIRVGNKANKVTICELKFFI